MVAKANEAYEHGISILIPDEAHPLLPASVEEQPPSPPPNPRKQTKAQQKVGYDNDSHTNVLFQMHGSVWPQVLPYCFVSVILTYAIALLRDYCHIDLTFPSTNGHNFMAIMVSFLVVTRANITYSRFMEAREFLSNCYRSCRELVHHVCILTLHDKSEGAREWRQMVAYRTILLLRVTMAAVEYPSSSINTWEVIEGGENMELLTPTSERNTKYVSKQMKHIADMAHGERTMADENFRAPIVMAYNLREKIMLQRNGKYLQKEMHVNEELKMLGFVSEFVAAFIGLKKLINTPFPFPLVQMNRTFLFFWVFSLPLVLVNAMHHVWHVAVLMFFITYGFLGLEYVSMELDDPYGDDPNDFDNTKWAEMCFEDVYIAIYKTDGAESAEELHTMVANKQKDDTLRDYHYNVGHEAFQ